MTLSMNKAHLALVGGAPAPVTSLADVRVGDEAAFDVSAREALLDEAFGGGREAKTSERLREGRKPADGLALVAKDKGALVGTLRCWLIEAGGRPALLLGPLAVALSHRSLGVGAKLMREALWRAATGGHKAVLLVGDAPYYARFGFEAGLTTALDLPGPVDRARLLGFEIEAGALDGAAGAVVATGDKVGLRRRSGQARRAA